MKRTTAVATQMLTVCKKCSQPNANGYQYCTACHQQHRAKSKHAMPTAKVPTPERMDITEELMKVLGAEA